MSLSTGVPLALIDGDQITARRTVAASALAASWLARSDARHLLVLGAGRVAALLPEAYRAVRGVQRVSVMAHQPAAAQRLAQQWRSQGAALFIDTDEALAKAGDLRSPMRRGALAATDVQARLADLCRGRHPGRRSRAHGVQVGRHGAGGPGRSGAGLAGRAALIDLGVCRPAALG